MSHTLSMKVKNKTIKNNYYNDILRDTHYKKYINCTIRT